MWCSHIFKLKDNKIKWIFTSIVVHRVVIVTFYGQWWVTSLKVSIFDTIIDSRVAY